MDVLDASFDLGLIKREDGGFLGIADRPDLHVDSVLHRAVIFRRRGGHGGGRGDRRRHDDAGHATAAAGVEI